MNTAQSNSITNTKYILTVFIVLLHCSIHADSIPNVSECYRTMDTILMMLYDCAVPAFFFLSSYLFFRNFTLNNFPPKLVSRIKSLLVPYFICSSIGFLLFIVRQLIFSDFSNISLTDSVTAILYREYDPPIWFLLILFEYVICAPAIFVVFEKSKKNVVFLLIALLITINLFLDKSSYVNVFFWMPLFVLGSYVGYLESKGMNISVRWHYGLLLFPLVVINFFLCGGDLSGNVYYTYRMLSGILVVVLGQVFYWKPFPFERFMMFVFLTHSFVHSPLLMITPPIAALSIPRALVIIVICSIIGWILLKFCPRFYGIMTGDR